MTKVDERAHVPPPNEAALERLAAALDREGVVAAMLIGWQARGEMHALSDVDIAVWHQPDLDPGRRLRLELDLVAGAEAALGTDQIDLIMLNRAPPLLQHRAIAERGRLVERDHEERVRLETRAVLDFLDTERLRTEQGRGLRRRIAEGRYGRRPRVEARIQRLEEVIERLDEAHAGGLDAYLANPERRAATERRLQTAIQICIDLATQVVMEISAPVPPSYAEIFTILGQKGVLPSELGRRLADAARQRNPLVHLYPEVDDRAVSASLEHLDDLRQFAALAESRLG